MLAGAAPGNRHSLYSTLYNIGLSGYSWASSVVTSGSNAYFLDFNSGGIYPQSNVYRAYGLPVRCLQE